MKTCLKKSDLSPARRRLVELFQSLHFGRIEGLVVRGGEPILDPPTRIFRERKFAGESGPRPKGRLADFVLSEQHLALLCWLDEIRDGVVAKVVVKDGLPFVAELAEEPPR
jgi:hypothetical protein